MTASSSKWIQAVTRGGGQLHTAAQATSPALQRCNIPLQKSKLCKAVNSSLKQFAICLCLLFLKKKALLSRFPALQNGYGSWRVGRSSGVYVRWRRAQERSRNISHLHVHLTNLRPQNEVVSTFLTSLQVAESCVGNAEGPRHAFNKSSNA